MASYCRCGPRLRYRAPARIGAVDSRLHTSVADGRMPLVRDAGQRSAGSDPTGTLPLQKKFQRDLTSRWNALRKMVPTMITARTDLARTIEHAAATGQDTVKAFQSWFDKALKMVVVGNGVWMARYVREAGDAALMRSNVELKQPSAVGGTIKDGKQTSWMYDAPMPRDRVPPLQTLAYTELQGIAEAVSQQAVRAFAMGLLKQETPAQIARDVQAVVDSVGVQRSNLLVSFIVVRTHAAVTLDAYRAAGMTHVGIVAERLPSDPMVTDAKKKKKKVPKDLVEVLTAGDEKVCQQCQDIEDEGPYTLDEAEALIPAHPRCRCAFVPWHDKRFKSVHEDALFDGFDENKHPRDKRGRWVGSGPAFSSEESEDLFNSSFHGNTIPRNTLAIYTGEGGHVINEYLRSGKTSGYKSADIQRAVDGMDHMLNDASLSTEVHGWRFVPRDVLSKIENGGTFSDNGFVSISAHRSATGADGKLAIPVILPKGSRALPIAHLSQSPEEGEVLVARNSIFHVSKTADGRITLRLDADPSLITRARSKIQKILGRDSSTHIAAGVMFLDPRGHALFVRRSHTGDHAGEWCWPGGACEPGETVQQAARRETLEESGHLPADLEQVDRRETDGVDFTTFATHVPMIFAPVLNHEHSDWVWRGLDNPPEPLHPGVRATIGAAVLGDEEWKEELHPRDKDGKFTHKGSGIKLTEGEHKFSKELDHLKIEHHVSEGFSEDPDSSPMFEIAKHDIPAANSAAGVAGVKLVSLGSLNEEESHEGFQVAHKSVVQSSVPLDHTKLYMSQLEKVGNKMGSNEGGTYTESLTGNKYYIKAPPTKDHVVNELVAAKLYNLAGAKTLNYVPVAGGDHVATELEDLAKKNVADLSAGERYMAQKDFAIHAWLANWDAAGTGGDNIGVRHNGDVVTLDTGGSLKYRAQGTPKGEAFGDKVTETETLRDSSKNPDAAALYGNMTNEQMVDSIKRVTSLPNEAIHDVVMNNGGDADLYHKLIARKNDLAAQAAKLSTAPEIASSVAPTLAETIEHQAETQPQFKTKMDHAKHLLLKGTTSEELKKSLNWPAIGVPATAASLGLKLEKTKIGGGAFLYKGTPMTFIEILAAKPELGVAKAKALAAKAAAAPETVGAIKTASGVEITKAELAPAPKHDINTVHGNFMQSLEEQKVGYNVVENASGHFITLNSPKDVTKAIEIAKYHPKIEKLSAHEYYASKPVPPIAGTSKYKYDIQTPHGNFAQGLYDVTGKEPKTGKFGPNSPYHGQDYVAVGALKPEDVAKVAKYHPMMAPIPESNTIYAKAGIKPTASSQKTETPFEQELKKNGVKYDTSPSASGTMYNIDPASSHTVSAGAVAIEHPGVQKLSKFQYYEPHASESPFDPEPAPVATPKAASTAITKTPATQAELDKAKKNTKLTAQYVPGAPADHPEAQKLIDKFNEKYEGKTLSTTEELAQKVHDFKQLQADMVPLVSEQQKAANSVMAEKVAKAKAKAEAAAKAEADKIANLHNLPEEEQRLYWYQKLAGDSVYIDKAESAMASKTKGAKLKAAGVTTAEVAFIKAFTGPYSHVNEQLREGHMAEEVFAFKHIMNEALDKLPKYDGDKVWRKIQLTSDKQDKYVVGKMAFWPAFSSTSKDPDTWSGNTHFTIHKPKSGVDVEFISSNPSEAEVIMPADTYYRVLSKKQSGGVTYIEMEETVSPFGKKKKAA